jgi:fimbrial chaperone protein
MRVAIRTCMVVLSVCLAHMADAAPVPKALEVAPTTLELSPNEAGLLYVTNRSSIAMRVQIDIYDWSQNATGDRLSPSDTAFVSPPLTTIAPGERQVVRVLAQPRDRVRETGYRLFVSELPNTAKAPGVRVLLQFNIPVFVHGVRDEFALAWRAEMSGPVLRLAVRNDGTRAAKLAGLRVSTTQASPVDVSADSVSYVLPGASHVWTVQAPQLADAMRLHIEGLDERSGKPVSADIGVTR